MGVREGTPGNDRVKSKQNGESAGVCTCACMCTLSGAGDGVIPSQLTYG